MRQDAKCPNKVRCGLALSFAKQCMAWDLQGSSNCLKLFARTTAVVPNTGNLHSCEFWVVDLGRHEFPCT